MRAAGDVDEPRLAAIAVDRRQVDEPFTTIRAQLDRHGRMTVERDVADPDQTVARGPERLRDDHHDITLDGEMRAGHRFVATSDREVATVDGIHPGEQATPRGDWQVVVYT